MTSCVLDTDLVIAALDRSDAHHRDAVRAVRQADRDGVELLLSTINYAEALVRPARDPITLRVAVDAISAIGITLVAPSAAVAREAARLRSQSISLADGFALATARQHQSHIATFDHRVRRCVDAAGVTLLPGLA